MRMDLHVHIKRMDRLSEIDRMLRFRKLDGIAVTNFYDISFSKWLKNKLTGHLIIAGKEICSSAGHILGISLAENVPDHLAPDETIERIHAQGGAAILPHPFLLTSSIKPIGANKTLAFDAIEVFNYRAGPLLWPNTLAWFFLHNRTIPLVANTDSKTLDTIGLCSNEIPGRTEAEIVRNLIAGRVRRHRKQMWPSPRWLGELAPYFLMRQKISTCGVCSGEMRLSAQVRGLQCQNCGKYRRTRIICKTSPDHFMCKECRTIRDYALPALLAYRRRHGLDIELRPDSGAGPDQNFATTAEPTR